MVQWKDNQIQIRSLWFSVSLLWMGFLDLLHAHLLPMAPSVWKYIHPLRQASGL